MSLVSTVEVREDKSENHVAEAQACYDWMNGAEGRRYAHGEPNEQEVFANIYLHWKKHTEVEGKLNPPTPQFKSEGLSFSGDLTKLPAAWSAQVMSAGGFTAQASDAEQKTNQDVQDTIKTRTAPHIIRKLARS